jgi:hypothetical protein
LHNAERGDEFDPDLAFAHNFVMTFGYVLARTAQSQKRVSVLDWGGGVGQYSRSPERSSRRSSSTTTARTCLS